MRGRVRLPGATSKPPPPVRVENRGGTADRPLPALTKKEEHHGKPWGEDPDEIAEWLGGWDPKAFDLDIEKTRFDRQRVGNRRRPVLGVEGVDPAMSRDASVHANGRMESIRR